MKLLKQLDMTGEFVGTGDAVTGQIPAPGSLAPGGSQMILYLGENVPTVTVPDFVGMTRQEAAQEGEKLGLLISSSGTDEEAPQILAAAQEPKPGTQVPRGTTVRIQFIDTKAKD